MVTKLLTLGHIKGIVDHIDTIQTFDLRQVSS